MKTDFKPLAVSDFSLTQAEKAELVKGAQEFLPPADETGEPIPTKPDQHGNRKP